MPPDGLAVVNADDANSSFMREVTHARVITYGIDRPADISAVDVRLGSTGTSFTLVPGGHEIDSRLVGRFNVSNWLAAFAAATYFGATPEDLSRAAAAQEGARSDS